MQAGEAERADGGAVEVAARPGEHRPHGGARVAAGVERSRRRCWSVSSLTSSASGTGRAAASSAATRRASGSRAHWAARVAAADRVGVDAGADERPQQADGVGGGQQVEVAGGRRAGDQPGERVAAGHHVHAAGLAGQQGPHLLGGAGVVQHDQHPPAGQQAAGSGRRARRSPAGMSWPVTPEGPQERGQRVGGGQRLGGVVAAQVHVELPVGEPVGGLVRPVQGQGGLADPGGAADRRDAAAAWPSSLVSPASSLARPVRWVMAPGSWRGTTGAEEAVTAEAVTAEARRRLRTWQPGEQRPGRSGRGRRPASAGAGPQPGAGLDGQLADQHLAGPPVGVQRLGPPAVTGTGRA